MKSITAIMCALLCSVALVACDSTGNSKFGVVDMNVLMKESRPGKAAQQFIESQENELQTAFDQLQKKLEKNPDNEKVLQEMQQVYASSQQKIQAIGQAVVTRLFDGIQQALQSFRQKNGYAFLLRAEALEAFDPALDVTRQALGEVNRLDIDFGSLKAGENNGESEPGNGDPPAAPPAPQKQPKK